MQDWCCDQEVCEEYWQVPRNFAKVLLYPYVCGCVHIYPHACVYMVPKANCIVGIHRILYRHRSSSLNVCGSAYCILNTLGKAFRKGSIGALFIWLISHDKGHHSQKKIAYEKAQWRERIWSTRGWERGCQVGWTKRICSMAVLGFPSHFWFSYTPAKSYKRISFY